MGVKFVNKIYLETWECGSCGLQYAMTQDFIERRMEDHKTFYCPAGCARHFAGKTKEQKLKEELARKQRQLESEAGRAHMLEQQKKEISRNYTRMRDRVKNGVCPCCNRTFENLLNHIKTKHPDFGNHETLKVLRTTYGLTQSSLGHEIGVNPSYISLYENGKDLPDWDKERIEEWVSGNQ